MLSDVIDLSPFTLHMNLHIDSNEGKHGVQPQTTNSTRARCIKKSRLHKSNHHTPGLVGPRKLYAVLLCTMNRDRIFPARKLTLQRRAKETEEVEKASSEAQRWISFVLGEELVPPNNFHLALVDGTVLVRLVNKLRPGAIKKWNDNPLIKFKMVENTYVSGPLEVFPDKIAGNFSWTRL